MGLPEFFLHGSFCMKKKKKKEKEACSIHKSDVKRKKKEKKVHLRN